MIVDHVSLPVRNLAVSAAFYDRVLATLGLQRRKERRGAIGWGPDAVLPPATRSKRSFARRSGNERSSALRVTRGYA